MNTQTIFPEEHPRETNTRDVGRGSYSLLEIAERNNTGLTFIYQEIRRGRLKTVRLGRLRRVTPEQEAEWHRNGEGV